MPPTPEALRTAAKILAVLEERQDACAADFLRLDDDIRRLAETRVPDDLRGRLDPEGVVQEAWLKLRDFGPENVEYRGPGSMKAYLARVVQQVMIDHVRHERAVKRGGDVHAVALEDEEGKTRLASPDPTPTSDARHGELQEVAEAELDPIALEVWQRRQSGEEFEEIGSALGRTAAAVRGIHHRARAKLMARLDGPGA